MAATGNFHKKMFIMLLCTCIHVSIRYSVDPLLSRMQHEGLIKVCVLIINIALYVFAVWLWTSSKNKTALFFYLVLFILSLSAVGFYLESTGNQAGFVFSVLRARLIDEPLLLGIFLISEYTLKSITKDTSS